MCKRLQLKSLFHLFPVLFFLALIVSCGDSSPSLDPTPTPTPALTPGSLDISSSNANTGAGTGNNGINAFYPAAAYTGKDTTGVYTMLQGLSNQTKYGSVFPAFIDYSVNVAAAGAYTLKITYSFGGTETSLRDCYIVVNGTKVTVDDNNILEFAYTGITDGKSNTFKETAEVKVQLNAGDNDIRLSAVTDSSYTRTITFTRDGSGGTAGTTGTGTVTGLPNIAILNISGNSTLTAGTASGAYYSLITGPVDVGTGSVSITPSQDYYLAGTKVTLKAKPAEGYTFDCWMAESPSNDAAIDVSLSSNSPIVARFLPDGATQPAGLAGYGAVQDDKGTRYTLTGGYGGTAVTVTTLTDLKKYLTKTGSYIVTIEGEIATTDNVSVSISVASNKTIYGSLTKPGSLKNIELKLTGENYIIRNLLSHEVIGYDGLKGKGNDNITINGAKHVWIDHCEFYSQLKPAACPDFAGKDDGPADGVIDEYDYKDYYDGQIDISDEARWITISNSYFHDHWKSLLWGDSDTDVSDASIRVTLHHNYFKNVHARLPMLRYGKAHVFNNYYDGVIEDGANTSTGVDCRRTAVLYVQGNYFLNMKSPVLSSDSTGFWNVEDNLSSNCTNSLPASSTATWKPSYAWTADAASAISAGTPTSWAGVGILSTLP
jgi:pectate lyase